MANEIRIRTSVEILQEVSEATESQTYQSYAHDLNAGGRSWGGKYDGLTYTDADVAYWKNNVVNATSPTTIDGGACFETSGVTDGTLPATAKAISVEFVSAIGTTDTVSLSINSVIFAALSVGESIVIPFSGGMPILLLELKANTYTNGTNEATVNVMVAGA